MTYTRNDANESKLHDKYHSITLDGHKWNTKFNSQATWLYSSPFGTSNFPFSAFKIDQNQLKSNSSLYALIGQVHEAMNTSLNAPDVPAHSLTHSSTYIILHENFVIASAIVAPLQTAYTLSSSSTHHNIVINRQSIKGAKFGVHRIHVLPKFRRRGLGKALLKAISEHQVYGYTLSTDEIAFSQPTPEGSKLAASWVGGLNYLVFEE